MPTAIRAVASALAAVLPPDSADRDEATHLVRAMDDLQRVALELRQQVVELRLDLPHQTAPMAI